MDLCGGLKKIATFSLLLGLGSGLSSCKADSFQGESSKGSKLSGQAPEGGLVDPKSRIPRVEAEDGTVPSGFEVGEEAAIANDVTGAFLSIPTGIVPAGQATRFKSTIWRSQDQYGAVRLVIPKDSTVSEERLVVLYRIRRDSGRTYVGLLPKAKLEVQGGSVRLQPLGEGIYQAAVLPVFVGDPREREVEVQASGLRLVEHRLYASEGAAMDLLLVDQRRAYVAASDSIEVLNWSQSNGLTLDYRLQASPGAQLSAVTNVGSQIYFAAGAGGVARLEATGPTRQLIYEATQGVTNALAGSSELQTLFLSQEGGLPPGGSHGIAQVNLEDAAFEFESVTSVAVFGAIQPCYAVQIQGEMAYTIGRRLFQALAIDDNDPLEPRGALALDGDADRLLVQGQRAYVVDRQIGIDVLDISDPGNPRRLGRLALPQAVDVAVLGSYLIVADRSGTISVIEATDPARLQVVHATKFAGIPNRVRVFGDYIFVTMGNDGIRSLSLSRG